MIVGRNTHRVLWGCAAALLAWSAATRAQDGQWRAQRLASLQSETGWLTPVSLYWLKEGRNTFGRDAGNDFVLNHPAIAPHAGEFVLSHGRVSVIARRGSGLTHEGVAVRRLPLIPDIKSKPTQLLAGTLHFMLIERAGHLGIRVRDSVSAERTGFRGLEYFPYRADWSIDARFEPYVPAREISIINILGMEVSMRSPGAAVFERDGRTWRLDTLLEAPGDEELFVMFSDSTSGRETYGAGRFLYAPLPSAGHIHLDFNHAYNPPCAFTDFATCPLPPPQNRIGLRVDAGELKYQRVQAAGAAH